MSFWSDASPVVKGTIVIGVPLIVVILVLWLGELGPFAVEVTQQSRGVTTATQ